jgi:hypothetical protein
MYARNLNVEVRLGRLPLSLLSPEKVQRDLMTPRYPFS